MYICIDFDGTVVDHTFPDIGEAVPGALEAMKEFHALGANLILWTMRSDGQSHGPVLTEAVDYLKDNGIELFGINTNPTQGAWTRSPKAYGHLYIDDAAAGVPMIHPKGFNRPCVDWKAITPDIVAALKRRG